jgi:maltose O-acetyltransferase
VTSSRPATALRLLVMNSVANRFFVPHLTRARIYRWCGVSIGEWSYLYPRQTIRVGRVTIGKGCAINYGGVLDPGDTSISIEDDVFIGVQVLLLAQTHEIGPATKRAGATTSAPIRVGRGCWLGARVTVLPGVTIAPGCVIAAGAVVTKDTEADGVYAGVPARRIRDLPARPDRAALDEPGLGNP